MGKLYLLVVLFAVWNICAGFFKHIPIDPSEISFSPVQAYDLDSTELMRLILAGPAPTNQDVLGTWTVDSLYIQYKEPAFKD